MAHSCNKAHHRRRAPLRLRTLDLETLTEYDADALKSVGPFDLEVYWFNRRILTKIDGIGPLAVVRRILATWAGGVSLYRDGYRVNPCGGPNDDWLDLDRDAFSTSGFKLNRGQIIGRARISQNDNRFLIDQTNREGLKDNPEKRAFVKVLSAIVELYRHFLIDVDRDVQRAHQVTATDAIARFKAEDERIGGLLPQLKEALSETSDGAALSSRLAATLHELRKAAADVQSAAGVQNEERNRVMHLASIGLMIEILAHELYRATSAGLTTIAQARKARDPNSTVASLRVLDAQLRTLQKRLKVLDPLSTNARQTPETFELVSWINDIVVGFASRNRSSRVRVRTMVRPQGSTLAIRAVKGMFVQVLENLLTNSLFWVTQQHRQQVKAGIAREDDEFIGDILVTVDTSNRRITVTDDGPGIPEERREIVFQPFFSTRPQKQGRGLGLYIAREIAVYHGGSLDLGDSDEHGQIHSVIFEIGDKYGN
jgi:C4-dicarboxylate-specific signal transduction histidine kinase